MHDAPEFPALASPLLRPSSFARPVPRAFTEVVQPIREAILMRKNQPQPANRAYHIEFEDARQDIVARDLKLRTEVRDFCRQQANPLNHRHANPVQQD